MVYIVILLLLSVAAYLLVFKPKWAAILLFTMMIADVNFEMSLMPINFRAILSLLLFARVLFTRQFQEYVGYFFTKGYPLIFLLFYIYICLVSYAQDLFTVDLLKQSVLVVLSCIMVLYFYAAHGKSVLRNALMIAALICLSDLLFTYLEYGTFPIRRIHIYLTNEYISRFVKEDYLYEFNHNFFGQTCGIAFVYLVHEMVFSKSRHWSVYPLMLLFLIGVLMSTSRSALAAMAVVIMLVFLYSLFFAHFRRQSMKILSYMVFGVLLSVCLFSLVSIYFNFEGSVFEEISFRLIDEPIAVFRKSMGYNYNIQNLGSLEWREEASANAFNVYMKLHPHEQFFGIGYRGFIERNLGGGLNPHNGILIILIQYGFLGFMIYTLFLYGIVREAMILRNVSIVISLMLFIILYSIGQNDEMTSAPFFLITFFLIAENMQIQAHRRELRYRQRQQLQMQANLNLVPKNA